MRSPHHLDGILDMTPLAGFLGIALALAGQRILGRLGDGLQAVLLDQAVQSAAANAQGLGGMDLVAFFLLQHLVHDDLETVALIGRELAPAVA